MYLYFSAADGSLLQHVNASSREKLKTTTNKLDENISGENCFFILSRMSVYSVTLRFFGENQIYFSKGKNKKWRFFCTNVQVILTAM